MTKEEKYLLLKDLCERLPYGVKVQPRTAAYPHGLTGYDKGYIRIDTDQRYELESIKPYLRPMSSMTEKEITEYWRTEGLELDYADKRYPVKGDRHITWQTQDYLVSHHLDYRGLIPMGLALTAPEDMYNLDK